jgi:predicted transcriptional regulator of viral defense system
MTDVEMPDSARLAGVVTAAELTASGISRGQVQRLVRRGVLLRLARGGYAPAALAAEQTSEKAATHAVLATAALAVTGPGAIVSHHSAALIHGLDLLGRGIGETVAFTRPPGTTSTKCGPGAHLHIADLPAGHVVARHGIPVTSVARTVIDLARASSFAAGVVVADSALRSKQTTKAELQSVITACPRWPGLRAARRAVAFCDARSESVLESISRVAFAASGLPPPDLQVWVGDAIEVIGRADFLWSACRTIAEADGAIKYADPSRAMAQLSRDARLREAGFEVVHFTWPEITRSPARVAASIRAAFQRGSRAGMAPTRPAPGGQRMAAPGPHAP